MKDIPLKNQFTIPQLSVAFGITKMTVTKMIADVEPYGKRGRSFVYDIAHVTSLVETREGMNRVGASVNKLYKPFTKDQATATVEVEDDPEKMSSIDKINFYKAEDLKQSSQLKEHKNDIETGKLMIATAVERTIADAFKKIALVMDTLPDLLERDGIIGSSEVEKVINVMDKARHQLAIDLTEISPEVNDINKLTSW